MPNRGPLYAAALLHDIARTEPDHAAVGAAWLRTLGYPEEAGLIARHHDPESDSLDDAALLYLADKFIQGDHEVTIDGRFAASRQRCMTVEAIQAHERRYQAAKRIEEMLNRS